MSAIPFPSPWIPPRLRRPRLPSWMRLPWYAMGLPMSKGGLPASKDGLPMNDSGGCTCCNPCVCSGCADGVDPRIMRVTLSGILYCPCGGNVGGRYGHLTAGDANGTYDCVKQPGSCCIWKFTDPTTPRVDFSDNSDCSLPNFYAQGLQITIQKADPGDGDFLSIQVSLMSGTISAGGMLFMGGTVVIVPTGHLLCDEGYDIDDTINECHPTDFTVMSWVGYGGHAHIAAIA
jgi:hypothetical protein